MYRFGCAVVIRKQWPMRSLRSIYHTGRMLSTQATFKEIRQSFSDSRSSSYVVNGPELSKKVAELPMDVKVKNWTQDAVGYFLPKGYPSSVGSGYDKYIKLQAVALLFSTTGGVLSMQSMLYAIGVGSGSVPLAATLNWIIKDGLGQLGGVVFASVVSNRFDADPKRWRMVASGSMDASSFIELLTPVFPHLFLPLASVANVGKNISFLAASASRAAAHRAFATHENLADITAKSGSQSILMSMLGTGLGISVATAIGTIAGSDSSLTYSLTLAAFGVCSTVNLAATYASLRNVTLTNLNPGRFDFIFDHYVKTSELLTPVEFAEREVLLGAPELKKFPELVIGPDLDRAVDSAAELQTTLERYSDHKFVLTVQSAEATSRSNGPVRLARVNLLLKEGAEEVDLITGLAHAYLIRKALQESGFGGRSTLATLAPGSDKKFKWSCLELDHIGGESAIVQAIEAANLSSFLNELGFYSDVDANNIAQAKATDGSGASGGPRRAGELREFKSSVMRNSYLTWHVEALLLERRYARISSVVKSTADTVDVNIKEKLV